MTARSTPAAVLTHFAGWGGSPRAEGLERRSADLVGASAGAALSRGLGRAYGDAALPARADDVVLTTTLADRVLGFDPDSGALRAEAGLSLHELSRLLRRHGYALPVLPGTGFVTLGGAVAADVHGKSHHLDGCFGAHLEALRMRLPDGRVARVLASEEPELFFAAQGGMGLTGHVLEVELRARRVPSPWIQQETHAYPDVEALVEGLGEASRSWPYTVAWLDAATRRAGRGVVVAGRWAEPHEAPATPPRSRAPRLFVPPLLPSGLVRPLSIRAFDSLWWALKRSPRRGPAHPDSFFHPLDAVGAWNRLFGRRGFTQYQCVLPSRPAVHRAFLELFQREGGIASLVVVKDCGAEGRGLLSFPKPGTSWAIDMPLGQGDVQRVVDRLNEFVIAHEGRIYLAKDAFTRREHFAAMEGERLRRFLALKRSIDPERRLWSAQAERLFGDEA